MYALCPALIASIAAFLTGSETSKSGRPIERLIGSFMRLGHVERLADSRGVDLLHPAGDPGVVHGKLGFSWWCDQ